MLVERIREKLREYLRENSLTETQFAKRIGIEPRVVKSLLEGKGIRLKYLEKIVESIGFSPPEKYTFVPVYESVSAGIGREVFENYTMEVALPSELVGRGNIKALRVKGDSMYPTLVDGAIIGVDISAKELRHNHIYVVYIPWKGAVVKRVLILDNGIVMLKSDNSEYPDIAITEKNKEEMYIIGRVVWSFQRYY